MATSVYIPKVGMTMEEGELVRWVAEDGSPVETGQLLFEMETDKVEIEVEAEESGTLRHLVAAGTRLKPGAVVACLLAPGEAEIPTEFLSEVRQQWSESTAPDVAPPSPAANRLAPGPADTRETGARIISSPAARRVGRELNIDLGNVTGTGPRGRIVEEDVRHHAESPGSGTLPATKGETIPYSGRRRTIGERLHQGLMDSAQFTLMSEVPADPLLALMKQLTSEWGGERISLLTPLIMKATAQALVHHPMLNATFDGKRIVIASEVNIGFATDLSGGLMVPVVRGVNRLKIRDLAIVLRDLVSRGEEGKLGIDDLEGGTFTVSSLAGVPVDAFTPILNPPQVAILGIGRLRDAVRIEDGEVKPGKAVTLSLTIDHRVIDGAPAGRFLAQLGQILRAPEELLGDAHTIG